jgi:hypothetical protein
MQPALKIDSYQATYWCTRHQTVWVKPEDFDEARAMQGNHTADVWNDWQQLPTGAYSKALRICLKKEQVSVTRAGIAGTNIGLQGYTVTGSDGKQRLLTDAEQAEMESDLQERVKIRNPAYPLDTRTGRPVVYTTRGSGSDPKQPWQNDFALGNTGPAAERLERERLNALHERGSGNRI